MKAQSPYKIIYILGAPHSGSTLVDMAIGSTTEAFSMGELAFYTHAVRKIPHIKIAYANGFKCSCGKEVSNCPIWKSVDKKVNSKTPIIKSRGLLGSISIILNLINPLGETFSLPIAIGQNKPVLDAVFNEIKKSKPKVKYLVDSSKDPRRLYELIQDKNINKSDIIVLHLVRDGRAYVNSYQKEVSKNPDMDSKSMIVSALEWIGIQIMSILILRKYNLKHLTIKYNQLAQNPETKLKQIFTFIGIKTTGQENIIDNINKSTFHNLQGNPLKNKRINNISYDQSWKTNLSTFQRLLYSGIFYPFNKFWIFKK